MDPFGDDKIAGLLRLKRDEQPPPGYFENFLSEFRRRQRDELLRQSVLTICLERAQNFVFRLNVRSLAPFRQPSRQCWCAARSFQFGFISNPSLLKSHSRARRSDQATEYGQRIGLRASGDDSGVQRRSDCSPCTGGIFGCCRLTDSAPKSLSRSSWNGNHSTISHC